MTVLEVTTDTWEEEVTNSDKPVLVDFWAEWCGPCRTMSPIMEQISTDQPEFKVVKVDIEANPELAVKFNIKSIPFFARFDNGDEITVSSVGATTKDKLVFNLTNTIVL